MTSLPNLSSRALRLQKLPLWHRYERLPVTLSPAVSQRVA